MKRKIILSAFLALAAFVSIAQTQSNVYVCLPCGGSCDKEEYSSEGSCEHCGMALVPQSAIKHTSISPEKVCKFIAARKDLILLDVRTREEFNGTSDENFGTLKNAINIPIQELENRLSELKLYKDKTILVFCSHSHRSPRASYLLTQNGFKNVVNMEGGMSVMSDNSCKK
jgi:rhodanese-related sulfurtransferase